MELKTAEHIMNVPTAIHTRKDIKGDADVIREVIKNDCYKLMSLYYSGFRPDVVFDIGAHIGTFTLFAHSLFGKGRYFCFEPNLDSSTLLNLNVGHIANVMTRAIYYGSSNDHLTLTIPNNSPGSGFISSPESADGLSLLKSKQEGLTYTTKETNINRTTIEEVCTAFMVPKIDLLKMDCEGGEWGIVENLSQNLANSVQCIKGEYHTFNGRTLAEFKSLMASKFPHLTTVFHDEKTHGLFSSFKK